MNIKTHKRINVLCNKLVRLTQNCVLLRGEREEIELKAMAQEKEALLANNLRRMKRLNEEVGTVLGS